jgi:hypothetical protein
MPNPPSSVSPRSGAHPNLGHVWTRPSDLLAQAPQAKDQAATPRASLPPGRTADDASCGLRDNRLNTPCEVASMPVRRGTWPLVWAPARPVRTPHCPAANHDLADRPATVAAGLRNRPVLVVGQFAGPGTLLVGRFTSSRLFRSRGAHRRGLPASGNRGWPEPHCHRPGTAAQSGRASARQSGQRPCSAVAATEFEFRHRAERRA